MAECTNCSGESCTHEKEVKQPETVPFIVYEGERARSDRLFKRMWIALIVAVSLLFASNAIWLWAWTSYDYYSEYVELDSGDGGNANYIGQDGDIYNNGEGPSAEKTTQEENPGEANAQNPNP